MEEKLDLMPFEEFLKTATATEETYWFEFDDVGNVIALLPGYIAQTITNKIQVDDSIVSEIYDRGVSLRTYKIDIASGTLLTINLNDITGLTTIDNVLHRIIDKRWTNISKPDISVEYVKEESMLVFKINPLLKTLEWQGDQDMIFLITEYNDPNILINMISFNVNELVKYPHRIKMDLPDKFSIYTRRLFDKYTFEVV